MNLVHPQYQWYQHVKNLAAVLQRVADGELKRLMVFMPPRHGKSELVSRLFSAYYLYRYPERWVGISSYAAELAYTFSRTARDNYRRAGGVLRDDAYAVRHWETGLGGGLWAAGVGGPVTGKGYNLGIIDDPLKNAEEAASAVVREKQKDWYLSTLYTREEPDAALIIIQTRWNEDDLSGWLLAEEEGEEPEGWHIVSFEAIKEQEPPEIPDSCTLEPDWRETGAALCPERYGLARLIKITKRLGGYFWNALFQQRPRAKEGNKFKRHWFEIVGAAPREGATWVRFWDKAATDGGGDWTAGVLVARVDGLFYILDVVRGQWSSGERDRVILSTAQSDAALFGNNVTIGGEQEPGASGKDAARAFTQLLAGFPVYVEPASGSKEVRAEPLASQCEARNVKVVRGSWNATFLEELTSFPTGRHDDQVDAASGAFNKLAQMNVGFRWL